MARTKLKVTPKAAASAANYKTNDVPFEVNSTTSYPKETLKDYRWSGSSSKYLTGIKRTEDWQIEQPCVFKVKGKTAPLTYNSCAPTFKNCINIEGARTYKIKVENNSNGKYLSVGSNYIYTKDCVDNELPDRIILIIQAAGGGGGGSSLVYALGICIGGEDGGAGGSGACAAVILNTKILKENPDDYYSITLGRAGSGAGSMTTQAAGDDDFMLFGNGTMNGVDGYDANNSTLSYYSKSARTTTRLITVGGGKKGIHAKGYNAGASGTGGTVTAEAGKGTYWWPIYSDGYNDADSNSFFKGKAGGKDNKPGESTPKIKLRLLKDTAYSSNSYMSLTIGNKAGGVATDNETMGGGASYFGKGGAGGDFDGEGQNGDGYAGDLGAGGGGSRFAWAGISVVGIAALAGIKGGGDGGKPISKIYY